MARIAAIARAAAASAIDMRLVAGAVAVVGATCMSGAAFGQAGPPLTIDSDIFPEWNVQGSNTLHVDEYLVRGQDRTASPYPSQGVKPYNDTELSFSRVVSPYENMRGGAAGVINYSPYRSPDDNFTLERLNMVWEKGDTEIPFRAEAGDFFGFYSLRTLQRALKGAQLDLQPLESSGGTRHSIQFMTGISEPTYRNLQPDEDLYSGASWLMETPNFGAYSLSGVYNLRQQDAGRPDFDQTVVSLAGQKDFEALGQRISLEGEVALFTGDVDLGGSASRLDRQDKGLFFLFDGRTAAVPLSYSFRYERYGDDFQPNGAAIAPNQELIEMRGGYRLDGGTILNARVEKSTDNLERGVALHTTLGGVTVSGPLLEETIPGSSFRVDTTLQNVENNPLTTDTFTRSVSANVSAPIGGEWIGNAGVRLQDIEDDANNTRGVTREINLNGQRPIEIYGWSGSFAPGLLIRRNTGNIETRDWGPTLALSLGKGAHSFSVDYSLLAQDPLNRDYTNTHDVNATYRYTEGAHVIGAEFATEYRDPESGLDTKSYKFGVFWRVNFARPQQLAAGLPGGRGETGGGGAPEDFSLTEIPPGLPLAEASARLSSYGIGGGVTRPGVVTYETRVLPSVDARQRIAVEVEGDRVTRTALIVDIGDPSDVAANSRQFERIRETLMRRYGAPDTAFTTGQFTANLAAEVNSGAFIRTTEWTTPAGKIRLGIPRRRDRQVRIEIQIARSFAPPRETLWSIEQAR